MEETILLVNLEDPKHVRPMPKDIVVAFVLQAKLDGLHVELVLDLDALSAISKVHQGVAFGKIVAGALDLTLFFVLVQVAVTW